MHYNPTKPTIVIIDFKNAKLHGYPDEAVALAGDDDQPIVFKNHSKAKKHVANNLEPELQPLVSFVNETPKKHWGEQEKANYKRCSKCNTFMHLIESKPMQLMGQPITMEILECPACGNTEPKK